jgi:hypothetical protein
MNVDPQTIIEIGAVVGGLTGSVAWLFKALILAKNVRINELADERDYWRDVVLKEQSLPEWEAWQREREGRGGLRGPAGSGS